MYFNVDELLMGEERVVCIFQVDAHEMGVLDPASDTEDISAGAKVELPFWLASVLAKKNMVQTELPGYYSSRFRDELAAGAAAVNLRDRSNFFYQIGGELARLRRDRQLTEVLLDTFSGERFRKIMDWSLNSQDQDITFLTRTLPHAERQLFETGYRTSNEYARWKARQQGRLVPARILASHAAASRAKRQKTS